MTKLSSLLLSSAYYGHLFILCGSAAFSEVLQIAAGDGHTCALFDEGKVKCWGSNSYGQLGYGDNLNRGDEAGEIAALDFVSLGENFLAREIFAGGNSTCALSHASKLKCWGSNHFFQLGTDRKNDVGNDQGEMGENLKEFDVSALGGTVQKVALSTNYTCVLSTEQNLRCWGANNNRILLGSFFDNNYQNTRNYGHKVTDVFVGKNHMCLIRQDKEVYCFGANSKGQLGMGHNLAIATNAPTATYYRMVDHRHPADVIDIALGTEHTCLLFSDGVAKCFGENANFQVGVGHSRSPVGAYPVELFGQNLIPVNLGLSGFKKIQSRGRFSCGLSRIANWLKCWGDNRLGRLGLGVLGAAGQDSVENMGERFPYVDIGAYAVKQIVTGLEHTCVLLDRAVDQGGTGVKCWGDATYGQIGSGSNISTGGSLTHVGDENKFLEL